MTDRMNDLTIRDMLDILKRRLVWIIIIPIVAALAVGFYYYYHAENEYTAETKLYVLVDYQDSTGQVRYDMGAGAQFAGDYQQLIMTPEVMTEVGKKLGIPKLDDLEEKVKIYVEAVTNTRVVNVRVTSKEPELSMDAANAITEAFVNYMKTITKTDSVGIASAASLPIVPSGPARARNTAIAYLAMLVLCIGVVLAFEMLNDTIRTDKDVEEALGIPVLARVTGYDKEMNAYLRGKGNGRKSLLRAVSYETQEDIKTLAMNLKFVTGERDLQVLALTSTAPSEGKSSITIMLANELSDEGQSVVLIDMDFRNPSLGAYVGTRERRDLVDYVSGKARVEEIMRQTNIKNVKLIDSYHRQASATNVIKTRAFEELIKELRKQYDMIIIDTPPLGMFVDAAVLTTAVDGLLLVVASGKIERNFAMEVVEQLRKAGANTLGVALNFMDRKGGTNYRYRYRYSKRYYSKQHRVEAQVEDRESAAENGVKKRKEPSLSKAQTKKRVEV